MIHFDSFVSTLKKLDSQTVALLRATDEAFTVSYRIALNYAISYNLEQLFLEEYGDFTEYENVKMSIDAGELISWRNCHNQNILIIHESQLVSGTIS